MDSRGGNMNEYELTVLIHPDLEANLDSALDKVRGLITTNGGEITKEDIENNDNLYFEEDIDNFMFPYLLVGCFCPKSA